MIRKAAIHAPFLRLALAWFTSLALSILGNFPHLSTFIQLCNIFSSQLFRLNEVDRFLQRHFRLYRIFCKHLFLDLRFLESMH